jgi:hypothetical protein
MLHPAVWQKFTDVSEVVASVISAMIRLHGTASQGKVIIIGNAHILLRTLILFFI